MLDWFHIAIYMIFGAGVLSWDALLILHSHHFFQDIAMIVLKTCLSFFLQCDFSVETSAIFEDKK